MEVKIEINGEGAERVLRNLAESIQRVLDNVKEEPERDEDGEPDCGRSDASLNRKLHIVNLVINELPKFIGSFVEARHQLETEGCSDLFETLCETRRMFDSCISDYRRIK